MIINNYNLIIVYKHGYVYYVTILVRSPTTCVRHRHCCLAEELLTHAL